jgi:hypothetical protein
MTADSKSRFSVALLLGFFLTSSEDVGALELTGAWAASADQCGKVFTRKGRANAIAFTGLSERHGGGFVIEASRIRGKFTTCTIKARKDDGQTLNLIAGCTTDIILSNVQFSLKVLDENSIARQFPGMEGSEVKYFRCPI